MILLRPICWLIGHKKINGRMNVRRRLNLAHLHGDAGVDFDCARCGLEWRDAFIPVDAVFGWDRVDP